MHVWTGGGCTVQNVCVCVMCVRVHKEMVERFGGGGGSGNFHSFSSLSSKHYVTPFLSLSRWSDFLAIS